MSNFASAPALDLATLQFEHRVQQLSDCSVNKNYQAYVDIDWETHPIEETDPRFVLDPADPLGSTEWYQNLSEDERARIGLDIVVQAMKTGILFENVLQRGMLQFALGLPDGDPSFRYAYHEVIEEAQHSMMFQEFINRSGRPPRPVPSTKRMGCDLVVMLGRIFPELFMLFVIGGEEPIDHSQKHVLKRKKHIHPLLARIIQIHITEEARHLCFARHWLRLRVPQLPMWKRWILKLSAPFLLGLMARDMLDAPREIVVRHRIPSSIIRAAFTKNANYRESVRTSLSGVRELCREMGLIGSMTRHLWRWAI
jgi:hypothetical protein